MPRCAECGLQTSRRLLLRKRCDTCRTFADPDRLERDARHAAERAAQPADDRKAFLSKFGLSWRRGWDESAARKAAYMVLCSRLLCERGHASDELLEEIRIASARARLSGPSQRLEQSVFRRYVPNHGEANGLSPLDAGDAMRVWTALSGRTALDFQAGEDLEPPRTTLDDGETLIAVAHATHMRPAREERKSKVGAALALPLKKLGFLNAEYGRSVTAEALGEPRAYSRGILTITDQRVLYSAPADHVRVAHRDTTERKTPTPDLLALDYASPTPAGEVFAVAGTAQVMATICLGAAKAQQAPEDPG